MDLTQVIKEPLITEKTMTLTSQGKYSFKVADKADKRLIKQAVEEFFDVQVVKVRTIRIKGKKKRHGKYRRQTTITPGFKKAVVQLKPGQTIDVFEAG